MKENHNSVFSSVLETREVDKMSSAIKPNNINFKVK